MTSIDTYMTSIDVMEPMFKRIENTDISTYKFTSTLHPLRKESGEGFYGFGFQISAIAKGVKLRFWVESGSVYFNQCDIIFNENSYGPQAYSLYPIDNERLSRIDAVGLYSTLKSIIGEFWKRYKKITIDL